MEQVKVNRKFGRNLSSDQDYERMMRKFVNFKKKMFTSKEYAKNFFIETGIYDKDGNLTENYR